MTTINPDPDGVDLRSIQDFLQFLARPGTVEQTGVDPVDWLQPHVIEWARSYQPTAADPPRCQCLLHPDCAVCCNHTEVKP